MSTRNSYSLVVCKECKAGLAESCHHHKDVLLSYSPLAGDTLSEKYRYPETSVNARLTKFSGFMDRYSNSLNEEDVNTYCNLAIESDFT